MLSYLQLDAVRPRQRGQLATSRLRELERIDWNIWELPGKAHRVVPIGGTHVDDNRRMIGDEIVDPWLDFMLVNPSELCDRRIPYWRVRHAGERAPQNAVSMASDELARKNRNAPLLAKRFLEAH